jgi:outer membrane protein
MFSAFSVSAAEVKIGFVNMNLLLKEAPQVVAINEKLQDQFGTQKKELDGLAESIQKQEQELKRNELLMTEARLKEGKKNLLEQIKEYRGKEAKLAKQVQALQNKELAVFREVVRNEISAMAKEDKFDLILNDGVMFAAESLNITDKLLERLKKQAKSKSK